MSTAQRHQSGASFQVPCPSGATRLFAVIGHPVAQVPGRVRVASAPAADSDILINATPVGLREDDPLPFDLGAVRADAVVADIIMKPVETRLLKAAVARGLRVHPGIHMLSEQIELYRQFFRIP